MASPDEEYRRRAFLRSAVASAVLGVGGCLETPEFNEDDDGDEAVEGGTNSIEEDPFILVPKYIESGPVGLNRVYEGGDSERILRLADYLASLHAAGSVGSILSSEEVGHSSYEVDLFGDEFDRSVYELMAETGDISVGLLSDIDEFFSEEGALYPSVTSAEGEDREERSDETDRKWRLDGQPPASALPRHRPTLPATETSRRYLGERLGGTA